MIKIKAGKYKYLREIADEYFENLNPKNKDNSFHKSNSIYGRINAQFKVGSKRGKYTRYGQYLYNHLAEIIKGVPKQLVNIQSELNRIQSADALNAIVIRSRLKKVFNYKTFRSGNTAKWLVQQLNITVCSYCNRQYISIIKDKETHKILVDFDHYFLKSKYPVFALSFYNLILTCNTCNSRLKHTTEFTLKNFIHPYLDSFNDIMRFSTNIRDTDIFFKENVDFNIKLKRNWYKNPAPNDVNRASRMSKILYLEELYNKHKEVVIELLQKHLIYTPEYVEDLYNQNTFLFKSKSDVYRIILGAYIQDSDLGKRPLSKFIKDISEEFGFLKLH